MQRRTEILSLDQLIERSETEPANHDLFEYGLRLSYLNKSRGKTHVVAYAGERIVGDISVQVDEDNPEHLVEVTICVEKRYREKGFARLMIEAVYAYASERKLKVVPTPFTEMGRGLKAIHNELDERYPQCASGIPHEDFCPLV